MTAKTIMDNAQIKRAVTRMAHEILEKHKGSENIVLLGIKTRGEHLAKRIQEKIAEISKLLTKERKTITEYIKTREKYNKSLISALIKEDE